MNDFLGDIPVTLASTEAQQCQKCKKFFHSYPDHQKLCQACKRMEEFQQKVINL